MDKLVTAICLLQEAKEERERLKMFEMDCKALDREKNPDYASFARKWPRNPKKSVINDNVKMARRLLLDVYM